MVKKIPNLSLGQIYPEPRDGFNLNTCCDPDCGNFGEAASFANARILGPGAAKGKAQFRSNSAITGWCEYTLYGRSAEKH